MTQSINKSKTSRYWVAFPDTLEQAIETRLAEFERNRFIERLWQKDPGLWSSDPGHAQSIRNRLGWLDSVAPMSRAIAEMEEFVTGVRQDGLRQVVLLGMGGSSLAPEVLSQTFGNRAGYPALRILDNTHPGAVRAVAEDIDPASTLFLVSSKSGGTTETNDFFHYFHELLTARAGEQAGRHFAAITDPGSSLEALAKQHGFRHAFINPPDIGGRYSALSYFALVPAALLGMDLHHTRVRTPAHQGPGVRTRV
jgi:glucose-6-phosphate isomerase